MFIVENIHPFGYLYSLICSNYTQKGIKQNSPARLQGYSAINNQSKPKPKG
jgi:hypothetical protein